MTKATQNLLLILVGAAVLWITLVTGEYVNYVKPGFRWPLVPAAVALVVLGAAGLRREWRAPPAGDEGGHDHGHEHGKGPRIAWLMCLPALAIFLIAPPALGSFTASRVAERPTAPPPAPGGGFGPLRTGGAPVDMTIGEFVGRSFEAQTGKPDSIQGVPVRLTGFVSSRKGEGWHLTRLRMACCAGDAIAMRATVRGAGRPPDDSWVRVTGIWQPPAGGAVTGSHDLRATSVERIKKPKNPYEA